MKMSVLFEHERMKLWDKWHFVENKTDYGACLKNSVNFLAAHIYKRNWYGYFLTCFAYANVGFFKLTRQLTYCTEDDLSGNFYLNNAVIVNSPFTP